MPAPLSTRAKTPIQSNAATAIAKGRKALDAAQYDEAVRAFRKAVTQAPEHGAVHFALGMACIKANRPDEAIQSMRCARDLAPHEFDYQMGLADAYFLARNPAHALPEYLRAGAMRPSAVVAWSNAGALYRELGRPELALEALHRALTAEPTNASALCNSALAFHDLGEFDIARDSIELALQSRPDYPEALWNRAILDLLHGDFQRGWLGHEQRTVQLAKMGALRSFPKPRWNGQRFDGKRLLLWPEQGLGDQLQFVRFLPRVKALGGTVVLMCSAPLQQLFRANCPEADEVIALDEKFDDVDLQLPLLSVPHVLQLGNSLDSARVPYMHAHGDVREQLNDALSHRITNASQPLRVGVCWAGQPKHQNDRNRSLSLEALRPLMQLPHVEWCSLQKGDAAEAELEPFNAASRNEGCATITSLGAALGNFADTALAVSRLDIVVSVDTSVAHLAGAMNVPTLLLIPFVPDWRWQVARADSPWYPSAQLFRQPSPGDWQSVVRSVGQHLTAMTSIRSTCGEESQAA